MCIACMFLGAGGGGVGMAALACTGSQSQGRLVPARPHLAPSPRALPTPCYVFISLVGSNRLLIKINSKNIFQTLKHVPPLIYVLKINPGGQPAKSVNCSFRHKSVKSVRVPSRLWPASECQQACLSPAGSCGLRAQGQRGGRGGCRWHNSLAHWL